MASDSPAITPKAGNTLQKKNLSATPGTSTRLPHKTPVGPTPSRLKQTTIASPSPFSPAMPSARESRAGSPTRSEAQGPEPMQDVAGEDSIFSDFSDITVGQFGAGTAGNGEAAPKSPEAPLKSSRPQTPVTTSTKRPRSSNETPLSAARPRSRLNLGSSPPSSPTTPVARQVDQTQNLMDFTQQFDRITRPGNGFTPLHRRQQSTPSRRSPTKSNLPPATPTESRFFNLLDFSPAPLTTPNSVPKFTTREVDDIKAGLNSQIMQIKAQLDGREAEVNGLRKAIQDMEERYAKLSEDINIQENKFEDERNSWQKVKAEMGELFEIEKAEKENMAEILAEKEQVVTNLQAQLETAQKAQAQSGEANKLKDRLGEVQEELRQSMEEIVRLREEKASAPSASAAPAADSNGNPDMQAEIQRVAQELHALYKAKHETKVAALKKSYEGRWEKKVAALTEKVEYLTKQNEELQHELEDNRAEDISANISFSAPIADDALRKELAEMKQLLESERAEKEGIVSLVEELLAIQNSAPPDQMEEQMRGSVRRISSPPGPGTPGFGKLSVGKTPRRDPPPRAE